MINEPLIILTVGSTGSSVLMRMLSDCGLWVGETLSNSKKHFYENTVVIGLNLSMIKEGQPPPGVGLKDRMLSTLARQGYAGGSWGFKDPRTLLTFTWWHDAYPCAKWLVLTRDADQIERGGMRMAPRVIAERLDALRAITNRLSANHSRVMSIDYSVMPKVFPRVCSYAGLNPTRRAVDRAMALWHPVTCGWKE